ncbi:hypothetical protein BV20DRAFT_969020 [Pilatotrama ljubarskyi]|nr:hypothetical protein BV20DRAFT_969020 [Pilatotrama ljubarskyi]
MSSAFTSDFVIRSRRKRAHRPVDPCLGFYLGTTQSHVPLDRSVSLHASPAGQRPHTNAPVQLMRASAIPSDSDNRDSEADPRGIQSLDTDGSAAARATVTVDEFLRRVASPIKHYTGQRARKRKKRYAVLRNSEDEYVPSSSADESVGYEEPTSSRSPRNRRKRQIVWTSDEEEARPHTGGTIRRRPCPRERIHALSDRLLLAGASTGVDVIGGPLYPLPAAHTSTRQPIPLVPGHRQPSPPANSRVVLRHYVDPRRAAPFRRASFRFAVAAEDQSPTCRKKSLRPVTAWKPGGEGVLHQPTASRQIGRVAVERLVMIPLELVPMTTVTDRGTFSMSSQSRGARAAPGAEQLVSSSRAAIPLASFVPLSPKHRPPVSAIGLEPCSAYFVATSSPPDPPARVSDSSLTSPTTDLSAVADHVTPGTRTRYSATNALSTEAGVTDKGLELAADLPTAGGLSSSAEHPVQAEAPFRDAPLPSSAAVDSVSTLETGYSVAARPMKPLGTLMDGLRDIARSATQSSRASTSIRRRPRPVISRGVLVGADAPLPLIIGANSKSWAA